jgi:asparagine synthase (glutamine-hydrolysing)
VILSGVGGDELFGGYRRYLGDGLRRYFNILPEVVRRNWLPALFARLPQDRNSAWKNNIRYASAFVKSAGMDSVPRYASYVGVFSPELRALLFRHNGHNECAPASKVLEEYFRRCRNADSLNQLIYVDIKTSLAEDLLLLTDKMSMAASIECRAPFIDQELVELSARIPSDFKVRGLSMKYLLKKAVQPWLPSEILHRKKRGFGAPVGSWLRRDLEPLMQETLSETQVRKRGFFDWDAVQGIIESHRAQRNDHTDHLLALINLELWCRIFLDRNNWQSAPEPLVAHSHQG